MSTSTLNNTKTSETNNTNNLNTNNSNHNLNKTVQIKHIRPELTKQWDLPHYATTGSAAMDLRACIENPITLEPNQCLLIPTGYAIYMQDPNLCAMILPRSGMGHKHGIILGNSVGLIDSDYQGELMISCLNRSGKAYTINNGDRIAQLIFLPVTTVNFNIVNSFVESQRATGGFGHTGNQ